LFSDNHSVLGLRLPVPVRATGPETARSPEQASSGPEIDRLRAENERLAGELAQTARLNELFAATLGHDLRNPLGAMLMSATIVSRKLEDESLKRAIGRILTAGNRMNQMIAELLDFTRARAPNGLRMECARTDVAMVFRNALDEISEGSTGRRVTFAPRGNTKGWWDPNRLAQVASSLVDNAFRMGTPEGDVEVRIDGDDSAGVTVEVRSAGAVPPEQLALVFKPFQGGDLHNRRGGLGLGLFITREIAAAHGGTVDVRSVDDATVFTLSLPRGS
jgi:two-component system, sensor histidine kinase and response regulator